ncbi:phage tail sheath family protein [Bavariicoccus seileri]|uniref:phage tail sheath family protein n=1 Tax=Bavariicoccus seileri TaxID=549685 RepID=UPI0003B54F0B|nr:phage tail sheath family protein [Bavariicoccus seileri]
MAGGNFTSQNKVRPGAYVNIRANGGTGTAEGLSGVVALPLAISYGPKEIKEVTAVSNLDDYASDLGQAELLVLKETLKRASKVLLGRVGSGAKASASSDALTVNALYEGAGGNKISVVVKADPNDDTVFHVLTYLNGIEKDTQSVKDIKDLVANKLVSFAGEGKPAVATLTLENGTSTDPIAADYLDFFAKAQLFDFNTLALPVSDETVKLAGVNFIKRLRDEEGRKCQIVVAGYAADSEAVINVKNGVILADGSIVDAVKATGWVAGATAAAGVAQSLTYSAYDGAIDVSPRYVDSDIVAALRAGEFVFTEKRGTAVVEQDINSLVTYGSEKSKAFSKNRVIRVLDDIANNTKKTFEDFYIGKVNNNVDGRELFKADRIAYFGALQDQGAIEAFDPEELNIEAGIEKDAVVMNVAVQPVDAMEKLYATVVVR